MIRWRKFIPLFLLGWAFHTFYGLCEAKWGEKDEIQTYLIGLKCYTTGTWPYFGADVNGVENLSFTGQLPGALEGLLMGLPFHLLPLPETPFIVLNLLYAIGAALLAWYICGRLSRLSFPLLFAWICLTPWPLHMSAHVINPAYDFLPSVFFLIGFMESLPVFSRNLVSPFWRNAAMGFSILWIMQFHFSYVFLLPLAAFALFDQVRRERSGKSLLSFALGTLPMAALMLPTYLKYGWAHGDVASGFAVPFDWYNFTQGFTILARYFSLVSFELLRFLGEHTHLRFAFLTTHWWLFLPGALLSAVGVVQPIVMFLALFKKSHSVPGWREMKIVVLLSFLVVWMAFWFTNKAPLTHIYLVLYPFVMYYSCYVLDLFAGGRGWGVAAKIFLACAFYFQIGYGLIVSPQDSLYSKRFEGTSLNRKVVLRAIQEKNYHLMGERRPESLY